MSQDESFAARKPATQHCANSIAIIVGGDEEVSNGVGGGEGQVILPLVEEVSSGLGGRDEESKEEEEEPENMNKIHLINRSTGRLTEGKLRVEFEKQIKPLRSPWAAETSKLIN